MLYDTSKLTPATEDNILSRTTEYDIYSYYIGKKVPINTKFSSPLREDKNPSFGLFVAKRTRQLLFKDMATGESGNCFKFVKLYLGYRTYKQTLDKINKDLNLGLLERSKEGMIVKDNYKPARTHIAVKKRNFTKHDIAYWDQFGITKKTLKKFDVFPIERVWVNNVLKNYIYSKEEPMYAYRVYNRFKIYRPNSKHKERFLGNCGKNEIQGLQQLKEEGDLLIITKSLKDVMVLYELGYNAIAPNSESSVLPEKIMSHFSKRYNNIIILYDNDKTGINGMIKFKKVYRIRSAFIPLKYEVKDISDLVKKYGLKKTKQVLKNITYG